MIQTGTQNYLGLKQSIMHLLSPEIEASEKANYASMLIETFLGLNRVDAIINKPFELNNSEALEFNQSILKLNQLEPIQYVLGFAWFMDWQFKVTEDTLIPRPETEELVDLINKGHSEASRVLDIGTGTGCIPIALKLKNPDWNITALDISADALEVAKSNAEQLGASINFVKIDILKEAIPPLQYDIVVSNPPYITEAEKNKMQHNVLNFEPHLALFVKDKDPLLFYRVIAQKSKVNLKKGGTLYFEINETYGNETKELMASMGYLDVQVFQDLSGKDRMVSGVVANP